MRKLDAHLERVVDRIGLGDEKDTARMIPPVTFEQERIDLTRAALARVLIYQTGAVLAFLSAWIGAVVAVVWTLVS